MIDRPNSPQSVLLLARVLPLQGTQPGMEPLDLANEGIAIAPESQCANGNKAFFWTDDGETNGHSLRADTIPCGPFIP